MITTKVKWKAIFVSLFFLCLYLFLLYIVIFIAVYITYTYTTDEDDADSQQELAEKGYTLPEYAFVVECGGATSGESGVLEVRGWIKTQFKDKMTGAPIANRGYTIYLSDGSRIKGDSDKYGNVEIRNLRHGEYFIIFED